jgi:hypothetical protein
MQQEVAPLAAVAASVLSLSQPVATATTKNDCVICMQCFYLHEADLPP